MTASALRLFSWASTLFFLCTVFGLCIYLTANAVPQLSLQLIFGTTPPEAAVLHHAPVWDGLWPAITGTLHLMAYALLLVVPLGFSTGVYLAEYAPAFLRRTCLFFLEIMAGVPSIVMGLFGFLLILVLRDSLFPHANTGLWLAAFCLALLVIPIFSLTIHAAVAGTPHSLRLTAACTGLPRSTALWKVYIPAAGRGIYSAFFLAAGRCAEDTAVILLTGAIANAYTSPSLTGKFEALPFFIYYTTANYQSREEFMRIFAAAFFLLILAMGMVILGNLLQRLQRQARQYGDTQI